MNKQSPSKTSLPSKKWRIRTSNKACFHLAEEKGASPLVARLLSSRFSSPETMESALWSSLRDLDMPQRLPDMEKAAERLSNAIINGEVIALETDHDADGVTSHAVLKEMIVDGFRHPEDKTLSFIGHRLKEGYGLSDSVVDRICAIKTPPTLVITADNGSSDESRIARLASNGIDTIVTDHHEIPAEGIPKSAYAVVSPVIKGADYPDPYIAGCMVAMLLVARTRHILIKKGHLSKESLPVTAVFDFVALGTIADCVSLSKSKNNRLIIKSGLRLINQNKRPCWIAMREHVGSNGVPLRAEDLAFGIAPRINARGRLDEAMAGVLFLLSKNAKEASQLATLLDKENTERKKIEKVLKDDAIRYCLSLLESKKETLSLVHFLENGHAGVHGIVASRITEAFGRPSVMLSRKEGDSEIISGSARGIDAFHVRDALQYIDDHYPGILVKFGGHRGAAGMTIYLDRLDDFKGAFEIATRQQLTKKEIGPVIYSDGEILGQEIDLMTLKLFDDIEPFGRDFDAPAFESNFTILSVTQMGDGSHLRLSLLFNDRTFTGVWFNCVDTKSNIIPVSEMETRRFLFSLNANHFNGKTALQLMIKDVK